MKYYPLFMDIQDQPCLVVGGGKVGARKAMGLLRAGARVRVISPAMDLSLEAAAAENTALVLDRREYEISDLEGMRLVFAATDNQTLNAGIRDLAAQKGILCNIADGTDKGDFILPAVVSQGDLLIAVSTCGASPALAKQIRKQLAKAFGPEYGELAKGLAGIRKQLLDAGHDPDGHKKQFTALVEKDLAGLIARGSRVEIDKLLDEVLGKGFSWASLTTEEL